jgi:hypothetical protein
MIKDDIIRKQLSRVSDVVQKRASRNCGSPIALEQVDPFRVATQNGPTLIMLTAV